MEVKINLNEKVRFKLSERGKEIFRHRYDGYGFEYNREPELDDDGYMRMQLWTFMQIFGRHMILGMPEVLNPLEIIYEENDAESATTTDCISRQQAIEALTGWETEPLDEDIVRTLESLPPVTPTERTGEWDNNFKCSNCGRILEDIHVIDARNNEQFNFCPVCGADMRTKDGDTECG